MVKHRNLRRLETFKFTHEHESIRECQNQVLNNEVDVKIGLGKRMEHYTMETCIKRAFRDRFNVFVSFVRACMCCKCVSSIGGFPSSLIKQDTKKTPNGDEIL